MYKNRLRKDKKRMRKDKHRLCRTSKVLVSTRTPDCARTGTGCMDKDKARLHTDKYRLR
jgi:hypothetical protein